MRKSRANWEGESGERWLRPARLEAGGTRSPGPSAGDRHCLGRRRCPHRLRLLAEPIDGCHELLVLRLVELPRDHPLGATEGVDDEDVGVLYIF